GRHRAARVRDPAARPGRVCRGAARDAGRAARRVPGGRARGGVPRRHHVRSSGMQDALAAADATDLPPDLAALDAVQPRVLWLAMRMVDYANRERASSDALKVGGHQASSASVVTLLTAMYFNWLRAGDRVSVKPHASPALHAVNYLLGRLDRRYLTTL